MPPFLKVLVLAVVQGVTEFLPVSSSGHLVLSKHFLGLQTTGVFLEIALHGGTLLSILIYYRKRLWTLATQCITGEGTGRFYVFMIVIATIPAGAAYAMIGKRIEAKFDQPLFAAAMLCMTGMMLLSLLWRKNRVVDLTPGRSFLVGIAQALALFPGISRSGSTIVLGRHIGFSPERAAEFSLLMAIPALTAALLFKGLDLRGSAVELGDVTVWSLLAGAMLSAAVGFACIVVLVRTLARGRFWIFGLYCLLAGVCAGVTVALGS